MIETPRITQMPAQWLAYLPLTIPRREIAQVMGPGRQEVLNAVKAEGLEPCGVWFTHHHRMDPGIFDFEICVPVTRPIADVGRVRCRQMPETAMLSAPYEGPYEGLGKAWREFQEWIADGGHAVDIRLYERYLVGPERAENPARYLTELSQPLLA